MSHAPTARLIVLPVALIVVACGDRQSQPSRAAPRDSLTERQRDSMLAGSGIPGARGVGRAMRVADSTSARVRAADSADVTP